MITPQTVVIDANLLVQVIANTPLSQASHRLLAETRPFAPTLIMAECANALGKAVRFANLPARVAQDGLKLVQQTVTLIPDTNLIDRAMSLALQLDHSVYDSLYAALADHLQAPLITDDKKFLQKLNASPLGISALSIRDALEMLP